MLVLLGRVCVNGRKLTGTGPPVNRYSTGPPRLRDGYGLTLVGGLCFTLLHNPGGVGGDYKVPQDPLGESRFTWELPYNCN